MDPRLTPEQSETIITLLRKGGKIEAVKRYREITNLSLSETVDRINGIIAELGIGSSPAPPPLPAAAASSTRLEDLSPPDHQAVLSAIHAGNKIEAIKLYRQVTGTNLADSKAIIDAVMSTLPNATPPLSPEVKVPEPPPITPPAPTSPIETGTIPPPITEEARPSNSQYTAPERTPIHWDPADEKKKGCLGLLMLLSILIAFLTQLLG